MSNENVEKKPNNVSNFFQKGKQVAPYVLGSSCVSLIFGVGVYLLTKCLGGSYPEAMGLASGASMALFLMIMICAASIACNLSQDNNELAASQRP